MAGVARLGGVPTAHPVTQHELSYIKHEVEGRYTMRDFLRNDLEHELKIQEMNYEVVIKELPEVIVYYRRMIVPNYDYYFEAIPKIGEEMKKANPQLKCAVPEYCFIIYHDGEYKEKDIDVEFCEAVTSFGNDTGTIKFKKIDRVPTAACVFHKGPYSTIGNVYARVFKWIADNGYIPGDNPRESYIDGIWNKEDPKDWLTELQVPVIKK